MESFAGSPSVLLMHSHLGNWELTSAIADFLPLDKSQVEVIEKSIYVVYKRLASKFWDRFMRENRQANLNNTFKGYVESGEVLRVAFRNKDKKRIYVFPTDQFPYWGAAPHKIGKFILIS